AYSELTVGRTELNEAFRAESQSAQLGYDLILLTQQRASQAERLKSLLNLPPDTVIGPVRSAPVYTVAPTVDELYDRAEHFSEMLKIKGLETQRAAYETFLAKLSRIPDVSAGLNFVTMNRARMPETVAPIETDPVTGAAVLPTSTTPSTPKEVLKNPRVGLFSMNLPIFEWRNRALVREQKALEETMRLDALSELNGVRAAVAQAYFQEELTGRLVRLYTNTLLPEAEGVMRQAETYFRNDQSSFSNVLETTLAYHNFTLARLRAVADHGQAIDRLEKVLGTTADVRSDAPETTPQAKDAKP
ncbi:MAG: TolC family protein, partial [Candidatus Hydrogenedentes bacterium]|nr:TolC family protein [Candidatus Hydrogenedentota bacterium]